MTTSDFKQKLAKLIIALRIRKRPRISGVINYDNAKTIGVIYRRVNKTGSSLITNFLEELERDKKKVYSLEYIAKEIDSDYKLKEINHFALRDEDLTFLKLPKKVICTNFCNKDFDIIINLSLENLVHLHYISSLCHAKMKVGFFFSNFSDVYDFMVDAKGSLDFKEHLKTMLSFVKRINKY